MCYFTFVKCSWRCIGSNLEEHQMTYRSSIRTITASFTCKCACCGGAVTAGSIADYYPAKRQIAHYQAFNGNAAQCYGVLRDKQRDPGFVDLDLAYEDSCADICGR